MSRRSARRHGVTLVEMVVVVALLAVAASIVMPKADAVSPAIVDAASGQVADAMRFARREAIRTGAYHVVKLDMSAQTLRVYRLTTSGAVAEDTSKPVLNPVSHRTYSMVFSSNPSSDATIVSAVFSYQSGVAASYASFGPDGSPADISGSLARTIYPLQADGKVTLRRGGAQRTVTVAAGSGRVTF